MKTRFLSAIFSSIILSQSAHAHVPYEGGPKVNHPVWNVDLVSAFSFDLKNISYFGQNVTVKGPIFLKIISNQAGDIQAIRLTSEEPQYPFSFEVGETRWNGLWADLSLAAAKKNGIKLKVGGLTLISIGLSELSAKSEVDARKGSRLNMSFQDSGTTTLLQFILWRNKKSGHLTLSKNEDDSILVVNIGQGDNNHSMKVTNEYRSPKAWADGVVREKFVASPAELARLRQNDKIFTKDGLTAFAH